MAISGKKDVRQGVLRCERAADDLRRGCPVGLGLAGLRPAAAVVLAVETITGAAWEQIAGWGTSAPLLVLSGPRAAALALNATPTKEAKGPPSDVAPVSFILPPGMASEDIRALADPTISTAAGPYGQWPTADLPLAAARATVCLNRMAGLMPAMLFVPLAVQSVSAWAARRGLLHVDRDDVDAASDQPPSLHRVVRARLPLALCENAHVTVFRAANGRHEHYAVEIGDINTGQPVLTRIHSQCFTGDVLGSLRCDCGGQLRGALAAMAKNKSGVLLYVLEEGRGIGLTSKLKAYGLQDHGFDTFAANRQLGYEDDERTFATASAMLGALGISQVNLMTNNPHKVAALQEAGLKVCTRVPLPPTNTPHNADYLNAKVSLGGHLF